MLWAIAARPKFDPIWIVLIRALGMGGLSPIPISDAP